MTAKILDGKAVAKAIRAELAEEVRAHWGERLPADCVLDDAPGAMDVTPEAEERR